MRFTVPTIDWDGQRDAEGRYPSLDIPYTQVLSVESDKWTDHADFGVTDAKGRKVGASAYIFTLTITEEDRPNPSGDKYKWGHSIRVDEIPDRLGVRYGFSPGSTRDGKGFGAYAGSRLFRSATERDAAVAKYFKQARARVLREAAKGTSRQFRKA